MGIIPTRLSMAINLASEIHNGYDKSSHPAILHPLRVMLEGDISNESDMIIRVLHDVIEDSIESGQKDKT